MTNFERTTLTQKGIDLLAKQGNQIEFLGVETGSGIYSQGESVVQLTAIKETVQSFRLTSVKKRSAEELALKFVLTNADLTEDYRLTEIGLYAHDPDVGKILYAVCYSTPENADMMRKYNGVFAFTVTIVLNVKIHPGSDVIIHTEGIYALSEDLQELQESVADLENPVYSTPTKRENLVSGEESTKAWGKIRRFFSDLKSVAFSGKYSDLTGTPDIPGKVSELANDACFITNNDIVSKADKNSPIFTGTPKAPTASAGTKSTQIATTAFVQTAVSNHNASLSAHNDIRDLITALTSRLNALADSDDTTLDQLSEIVDYIKSNRSLIEGVTTNKVNVSDIINNLTSTAINKPLSAKQGKILNDLIATLSDEVANITTENIGAAPYAVVVNGDFNDMTTPGLYTMRNGNTNAPITEKYYYSLIVLRSDSSAYVQQMAITEGTTDVYVRYGSNSRWGDWTKLMVAGDTAANAANLGGYTVEYFAPWTLHKVKINLNRYTSLGDSSLILKGNSVEIGQHTDVAVLGVDTMGCWLAGWSYSGLTLSVNVVTPGSDDSATVCYLTKE